MTTNNPEPIFIDNPHAPELFAGAATGFWLHEGVVHITFEAGRVDHSTTPGPVTRVVVGRLALPAGAAHALAVGLFDFLKQQGFSVGPPVGNPLQ